MSPAAEGNVIALISVAGTRISHRPLSDQLRFLCRVQDTSRFKKFRNIPRGSNSSDRCIQLDGFSPGSSEVAKQQLQTTGRLVGRNAGRRSLSPPQDKYRTNSRRAGAVTTFLQRLFDDFVLEHGVGQQSLESRVLAFEFLEPLGVRNAHASKLVAPELASSPPKNRADDTTP